MTAKVDERSGQLRRQMSPYTFKEKAKITAGAVTALVIIGWLAVIALAAMTAR